MKGDANLGEAGNIRKYETSFLRGCEEDFGRVRGCAREFQTTTAKSAKRILARSAGGWEEEENGETRRPKVLTQKEKIQKEELRKASGPMEKISKERKTGGGSKGKYSKRNDSEGVEKMPKVEEDTAATGILYSSHKEGRTELGTCEAKKRVPAPQAEQRE